MTLPPLVKPSGPNWPKATPLFHLRTPGNDLNAIRESWVDNCYRIGRDDFRCSGAAVDLGANVGAFTLLAAQLGAQRVVAYEPQPENAEILRANIAANPHLHATVFNVCQMAISDTTGKAWFSGVQTGAQLSAGPDGSYEVETVTLDIALQPFPEVDVLKLDVEHAEYKLIPAASQTTLRKCRRIVMEFHDAESAAFGRLMYALMENHSVTTLGRGAPDGTGGGYLYCARK